MNAEDFKVGDRVVVTGDSRKAWGIHPGMTGVVCKQDKDYPDPNWVLCEFEGWKEGHDGNPLERRVECGPRWFMNPFELQKVTEPKPSTWRKEQQEELQALRKRVLDLEHERSKHVLKFREEWKLTLGDAPVSVDMIFGAKEMVADLLSGYIEK